MKNKHLVVKVFILEVIFCSTMNTSVVNPKLFVTDPDQKNHGSGFGFVPNYLLFLQNFV
jgi:hypothetical protein